LACLDAPVDERLDSPARTAGHGAGPENRAVTAAGRRTPQQRWPL